MAAWVGTLQGACLDFKDANLTKERKKQIEGQCKAVSVQVKAGECVLLAVWR